MNKVWERCQDIIDFFLGCIAAKRKTDERVGFIIISSHCRKDMRRVK